MAELTREEWLRRYRPEGSGERILGRVPTKRVMYPDYVYFLRCGDFVKIGTSRNPRQRLATLAGSVPYQCELILVISGPPSLERELHHLFRDARERYEWFALTVAVCTYIDKHKHRCLAARFSVPGADVRTKLGTTRKMDHLQKFNKNVYIQCDNAGEKR